MPWQWRVYRLLKLGVTLTEQGFDDPPGFLLDWLEHIDGVVTEVSDERERRANRGP